MNHRWMIPVAVAATAIGVAAQPNREDMIERREAKLAEDWVTSAPWTTNYEVALADAKESGKLVFAYFSRSYAP